jgi:gamma-glutamyltranspeptidase/glutathione hydrolase
MVGLTVTGCASNQPVRVGAHQINAGVAADEPRAVLVGRDILAQGGNAVDAAAAMGLAMTATLPTRVGLGGGGICVVHDATSKQTRTIDFLPRAAGGGDVAVPSMLRGLSALHAAHGKLRWEQIVVPAEAKARFDNQISRALARDLQVFGGITADDPAAKRVYLANGAPPAEGEALAQTDLSNVLGQVRQRGASVLYTGTLADQLAAGLGTRRPSSTATR